MKTWIAISLLFLAFTAAAAEFPAPQAYWTQTNLILSATPLVSTNAVNSSNTNGAAYEVEGPLYHTFQFTTTCTNSATLILDRTLNQTGWVPFYTNTVTATGTNDTTLTGKWQAVRARFTGSNATCTVLYMGGR